MMHRAQIEAHMRALITAHGCLDAASEAIGTRWGHSVGKGTLSRRMSGELPWTILDVIAMEDALGRYPVTRAMARRQLPVIPGDIITAAQAVATETGEAVAALIGASLSSSPAQRAAAIGEIDEAIAALRHARESLGATGEHDG